MNEAAPDRRPSKIVTLYIPAALGILAGIGSTPFCGFTGYTMLLFRAGVALGTFLFSWPFIMAGYHCYRFIRSFFRRP
jgi:hypothetical protein